MYLLKVHALVFYLVDYIYKNTKPTRNQYQRERDYEFYIMNFGLYSKSMIQNPELMKSRSSAGQSATLIMQRSAVRACPRLLIKGMYQVQRKLYNVGKATLIHYTFYFIQNTLPLEGELAQLARAPALHAGGQGFDSLILHSFVSLI